MLVLTRKPEESIVLGNDIEVKILGIEEGKVKLGIQAPRNIEIHRKEIFLEIQEENRQAAGRTPDQEAFRKLMKPDS